MHQPDWMVPGRGNCTAETARMVIVYRIGHSFILQLVVAAAL